MGAPKLVCCLVFTAFCLLACSAPTGTCVIEDHVNGPLLNKCAVKMSADKCSKYGGQFTREAVEAGTARCASLGYTKRLEGDPSS